MTKRINQEIAANLLHARGSKLSKGDPLALPITTSSMYHLPGDPESFASYGRMDNPTWEATEESLALLEQAPCVSFPSGMAAVTASLFATLSSGKTLLVPSDGYYVTRLLSKTFLAEFGVKVIQRPTCDFARGGFEPFDVIFIETPSNPGLDLCDIAQISTQAHRDGALVIVDNTTMTPLGQRPLDLGADLVVASDTKAPGGHSDLLMGHVATRDPVLLTKIRDWRRISGSIPSPHAAWALHRGLETFEIRFQRMCESALTIAPMLKAHGKVSNLRFPGLQSDPAHSVAARQMSAFGFMISFELDSRKTAETFIESCPLLRPATSFGGVHSSAECRIRWGDDVAPGFVRLAVGCEPTQELADALLTTLDKL